MERRRMGEVWVRVSLNDIDYVLRRMIPGQMEKRESDGGNDTNNNNARRNTWGNNTRKRN